MADPAGVLRSFLLSHKLDDSVINFVLADCSSRLGCESISDFAGYWTDSKADFHGDILAHLDSFKDKGNPSKIQLSRLRIAWQQAAGEAGKAQTPPLADPEAPPVSRRIQGPGNGLAACKWLPLPSRRGPSSTFEKKGLQRVRTQVQDDGRPLSHEKLLQYSCHHS